MIMRTVTESEPTETQTTETTERETETTALDLDDIARQVYPILKRRLARERERALGIS